MKDTLLIDGDSLCFHKKGLSLEDAITNLDLKINNILLFSKCINYEIYLTIGKCFRYDLLPTYKANRKFTERPEFLKELKQHLIDKHNATFNEEYEADDLVLDRYREDTDKYIFASIDKDLLYNHRGKHINLYDISWVNITEEDANEHFYTQIILGDKTDNIDSLLPNVGEVRFKKLKEYSGLTYETLAQSICFKLNESYNLRYRLIYCGESELNEMDFSPVKNEAINLFIDFSNKLIKFSDIEKYFNDEKKKPKKKIIKRKTIKEYSPTDKAPGKHKDKTWLEVKEVDINYIEWMICATKDNKLKEMLEEVLR